MSDFSNYGEMSVEERAKAEADLLAEDRMVYARMFFEQVAKEHNRGNASAIRLCLMKSVYPATYHEAADEPIFTMNDGQWLSKWKDLNRFLPKNRRFSVKPTFSKFIEGLTIAASYSNLRLGQMMCWLSESKASNLFKLESKHFKLGLLQFHEVIK